MKGRRPGLQKKWAHVVNSLQRIIPSYEEASSLISMLEDRRMRSETASFAAASGRLVLDLGSGPGTMSRHVARSDARPVLLDVSRAMLSASGFPDLVQGVFEALPFRPGAFDGAVSGFALRDAHDLGAAIQQVATVLKPGGRFGFCDLGKPNSQARALMVALYLRTVPAVVGLATAGRQGLGYGSIFDTYILVPHNAELARLLSGHFASVTVRETQFGGSIVILCQR